MKGRQVRSRIAQCAFSLAPLLRGEGWGEGLSPQTGLVESPPHPIASRSTSPRKRGEVKRSKPHAKRRSGNNHFIEHLSWNLSWSSLTMVATVFSES